MAKTLETAKSEVQAIFTAATSENGKGAMESGLSLDDQGNVCGYLMKKGEGRCSHTYNSIIIRYQNYFEACD